MSNDLQTRDKQGQEVDSSEQYAINAIGDKVLQSADYVSKESKRALEKVTGKNPIHRHITTSTPGRAYQPVTAQPNAERQKAHTPEYVPPPQNEEYVPAWVKEATQHEEEKREPVADAVRDSTPTPPQKQGGNAVKKVGKIETNPSHAIKNYTPYTPKNPPHNIYGADFCT